MSPHYVDCLKREFPKLYKNLGYFEIGHDGWFDLLYKLSAKLEKLINQYEREGKEDEFDLGSPHADQVKEKFGTLRFYMSHGTKEMQELINEAEDASSKICIVCGRKGKIRNERWVSALCEQHYREKQ